MGRTMDLLTPVSREARRILGPGRPEIIKATDDFPEPGYRVSLEFWWDEKLIPLLTIGQNPSKASRERSDHTVTRCARRAWMAGHGGLAMLNIFPDVATQPSDLWANERNAAIDAANEASLIATLERHPTAPVLFAPGDSTDPRHHVQATRIETILVARGRTILCVGVTAGGYPRHPSRAGYDRPMVPWSGPWPTRAGRSST